MVLLLQLPLSGIYVIVQKVLVRIMHLILTKAQSVENEAVTEESVSEAAVMTYGRSTV